LFVCLVGCLLACFNYLPRVGPQTSILLPIPPCNWNHRHIPPNLAYWLRWDLAGLASNLSLPYLYLLRGWDYRHEQPH
jgi:hypothetical protein